ncbi:MAG: lysostaphin resistance A-like protein [Salinigranum sp.]
MGETFDAGEAPAGGGRFFRTRFDRSRMREASWVTVVAVAAVAAVAAAMTVAFQAGQRPFLELVGPIVEATGGLVHPTLLVYVPFVAVVIWGLILRFGGLRPRDVGLVRRNLPLGVAVTVGTWLLVQATGVGALLASGHPVQINEIWAAMGVLGVIGSFLGQILGNAFFEEVVYRAFLVVQLEKKFDRWIGGAPRRAFLLALVVSQVVFALIHVPSRLVQGVPPGSLLGAITVPFLLGVLLALVYYRTGNLFVVVGLHALINQPVLLVDAGAVVLLPLLIVLLGIAVGWPYVEPVVGRRGRRERGTEVA